MATKDIDLEFRSNSRFGYCNTNYAMLALVIEKNQFIISRCHEKIVFKPLGMTNTYVFDYEKTNQQLHLIEEFLYELGLLRCDIRR
jgi:CubicO group peptidase (beta-lactamase class C family)